MAYDKTSVSVSSSQEQIRNVLIKHRCQSVNFGERYVPDGSVKIGVEFVYADTLVRMLATISPPEANEVSKKVRNGRSGKSRRDYELEMTEQESRRMWRVLHWAIKVRMEAIEEGLELFEQAFLAHIVDPTSNVTLWDSFEPAIAAGGLRLGGTGLRALEAGR